MESKEETTPIGVACSGPTGLEEKKGVDGKRSRQPKQRRPTRIWKELGSKDGRMEILVVEEF